jgi:tetratricopeptide (TPR) repeat protein
VLALAAAGCASARRIGVGEASPLFTASMRAYESETDLAVARSAAPALMKLIEGLLETAPNDRELLEVVARGWAEFAFAFLEDDFESLPNDAAHADERARIAARATALYDRAFGFAARRLQDDDHEIERALAADVDTLRRRLERLPRSAVPGLAFAGLSLSSAINVNPTDPSRAVDLPKAIALLERARALDPTYYYGGAQMVLGLIYCSAPKAAGGDPTRGQQLFDESMAQTSGRYLLPKVMAARQCAVRRGDRAGFERALRQALATPPSPRSDEVGRHYNLANEVAKRRAARYLDEAGTFFR